MKKIGLLSDTHGFIHPKVSDFFMSCDEIWHAGDIGNIETADKLAEIKLFKAVYGNIDGGKLRQTFKEFEIFRCENVKVLMIHIGGYPGRYTHTARKLISEHKPKLFISGHSHILKVMPDPKYNLLHINPGSAGKQGLHKMITMVRFVIDGSDIKDLEVFEVKRS
ncbi:MAG: metallophosphoesterase family protein [Deltaproteobacteria bacterium]|nr:metallophosphoesterase family protein [Deltaproteobacteria bacterium]